MKSRPASAVLTRPEAAVLLSYSKIYLAKLLDGHKCLSHPLFEVHLAEYFPTMIHKDYQKLFKKHPLKDSITRTQLVNTLVSEMGIVFVTQVIDECACHPEDVIIAYSLARQLLGIDGMYKEIMASSKIDYAFKLEIAANIKRSVYLSVRWILKHLDISNPSRILKDYTDIQSLSQHMLIHLPKKYTSRSQKILTSLQKHKVTKELTNRIRYVRYAYQLFNVRFAQIHAKVGDESAVMLYYQVSAWLKFHQIRERLLALPEQTYWDRIQKYALEDELTQIITLLTIKVIRFADKGKIDHSQAMRQWLDHTSNLSGQIRQPLTELLDLRCLDYAMFSVVVGRIRSQLHS